jgi:hypothetical protein
MLLFLQKHTFQHNVVQRVTEDCKLPNLNNRVVHLGFQVLKYFGNAMMTAAVVSCHALAKNLALTLVTCYWSNKVYMIFFHSLLGAMSSGA